MDKNIWCVPKLYFRVTVGSASLLQHPTVWLLAFQKHHRKNNKSFRYQIATESPKGHPQSRILRQQSPGQQKMWDRFNVVPYLLIHNRNVYFYNQECSVFHTNKLVQNWERQILLVVFISIRCWRQSVAQKLNLAEALSSFLQSIHLRFIDFYRETAMFMAVCHTFPMLAIFYHHRLQLCLWQSSLHRCITEQDHSQEWVQNPAICGKP